MLKKNTDEKSMGDITTLIARNTEIVGTVNFSGDLEIEGRVIGDAISNSTDKTKIRLLEQGIIEGTINAPHVIINGHVKGDIYASKMLELSNKAIIEGNIHYNVIEMSKGAKITGSLLYGINKETASQEPNKTNDKGFFKKDNSAPQIT